MTWGSSPACSYDESLDLVYAELVATGSGSATVTVTAHADENTSRPVGSGTEVVEAAGPVSIVFDASRAPYVDIDGVAACSLDVSP